jgi:hypothetical protein
MRPLNPRSGLSSYLSAINPTIGAATSVGTYSGETGMNALVGSSTTGTLIGGSFSDNNVYAINAATGALSLVKMVSAPSAGDFALVGSTLYESACAQAAGCGTTSDDELLNVNTNSVVGRLSGSFVAAA